MVSIDHIGLHTLVLYHSRLAAQNQIFSRVQCSRSAVFLRLRSINHYRVNLLTSHKPTLPSALYRLCNQDKGFMTSAAHRQQFWQDPIFSSIGSSMQFDHTTNRSTVILIKKCVRRDADISTDRQNLAYQPDKAEGSPQNQARLQSRAAFAYLHDRIMRPLYFPATAFNPIQPIQSNQDC